MGGIYLASGALALFFVAILAGKKNKGLSDHLLLAWFILLFSNMMIFYLIHQQLAPRWLVEILNNSAFLHGPILYLYTAALTGERDRILPSDWLHMFPFALLLVVTTWLTYRSWPGLESLNMGLIVLKFLSPLIYILLSQRMIVRHRDRIEQLFSSTSRMELRWLSSILWGGLILIILGIVTHLLHYMEVLTIPDYGGLYLNIAYSLSIVLMGYFGFRQTSIFLPEHLRKNRELGIGNPATVSSGKYQKSRLDEGYASRAYQELLDHMENDKPFLDPGLSLYRLAEQLNTTENKLSQLINSRSGANFFEFVNRYRVEMLIKLMKEGELQHSTLLGLALDSGFNSKASFNRAFKKFTGQTPSEYLKNNETIF
jgi:AraC-like DNA-binding protein